MAGRLATSILTFLQSDKGAHLMVSALLVLLLGSFLPLVYAFAATIAIGIGKELWDNSHGGYCTIGDVFYDFMGCTLGTLIACLWLILR